MPSRDHSRARVRRLGDAPARVPAQRTELPPEPLAELEKWVARLAELALQATVLADRYEGALDLLTEPSTVADQRARVRVLRSAAARSRDHLVDIARP